MSQDKVDRLTAMGTALYDLPDEDVIALRWVLKLVDLAMQVHCEDPERCGGECDACVMGKHLMERK